MATLDETKKQRQAELNARAQDGGEICQDDYEWASLTGAYKPTRLRLTQDRRDESGDSDFLLPAGTIVNLVSDEGDWVIIETLDGKEQTGLYKGTFDVVEEVKPE